MGLFKSAPRPDAPGDLLQSFYTISALAADNFMDWHRTALQTKDFSEVDRYLYGLRESSAFWLEASDNGMSNRSIMSMRMEFGPRGSLSTRESAMEKAKFSATKQILNECHDEGMKLKLDLLEAKFVGEKASYLKQEYEVIQVLAEGRNNYVFNQGPKLGLTASFTDEVWREICKRKAKGELDEDFWRGFRKKQREYVLTTNEEVKQSDGWTGYNYLFPDEPD